MKVNLVWVTPDAEKTISYCARVSNPSNQDNPEYAKLLAYCIQHGHWSPFEMAGMCVEITTSRAIAQQIIRHRSFSFQEFSQRYAKVLSFEDVNFRTQDAKNRQSSINNLTMREKQFWFEKMLAHVGACQKLYEHMLDSGIAKECARMVLPLCTTTKLYMSGTMRSWIHYINLRTGNGTQAEHTAIAKEIKVIFMEQCPAVAKALEWV